MRHPLWLCILFLTALVSAGCGSQAATGNLRHGAADSSSASHDEDGDEEDGDEEDIAISAVPANVLAAAQAALPGVVVSKAVKETENGVVTYSREGLKSGVEWKVEVTADGRVLEVEQDDD